MKIINIGPAHPLRGGIANFNESLSTELMKQGHDVYIYSYSLQYPNFLFPGKTQFSESAAPHGLNIKTKINSINPFNWLRTGCIIKKEQADLVIIHYWMSFFGPALGTMVRLIAKNKQTKVIALCHNITPHEKKFYDTAFTSFFIKKCHGFIAMSKAVLDDLNRFTSNSNKVFSPHPAYDIFGEKVNRIEARQYLGLDSNKKIILFFGVVRGYKGLDLLLEALAKPILDNENIALLIAGEFYESEEEYRTQIKQLGIENRVIIHNEFIPTEKVKHYFSAADIVAQTYKTATQSGVTQIAYHFDVPMLVTNVGGLAEIVPHKEVGYVCEKNPENIASDLADFFENERFSEYSKNTANRKHLFSWGKFADDVISLIQQ